LMFQIAKDVLTNIAHDAFYDHH